MAKKEKKPKSKGRILFERIATGVILVLLGFVGLSLLTGMIFKKNNVPMMFNSIGTCYVLTDSMEPEYPQKTTIIVQNCSVKEIIQRFDRKEIVDVTFQNDYVNPGPDSSIPAGKSNMIVTNQTMTHRMIGYYVYNDVEEGSGKYIIYAAGINDQSETGRMAQYQAFTEKQLVGRVVGKSQFLGFMTRVITSVWGLLILLLIPSFYMIITSVLDIFKYYKDPEEEEEKAKDVVSVQDGASSTIEPSDKKDVLAGMSEEDKERLKKEMLEEMLNGKKGGK